MADHIRIQVEQLEELRGQMMRLSDALEGIKGELGSIDLRRISGSEVRVRMSSSALGSIGRRMPEGDAEDCLNGIARVINEMGRYTHAVAGSIGMAADVFADTERGLARQFGVLMHGEGSMFQEICGVVGLNPDRSKWTPEDHKKYNELINSGKLIIDGGMGLLIHEGKNYLFGNGGLLGTYEEKNTPTGTKQTLKVYPGDGMAKLEYKEGLNSLGGKTKFDIIEQKEYSDPEIRYDKDGNLIEGEDKDKKKLGQKVGVLSIGASGSAAVSAWHTEGSVVGERGKAEGSIGVGNAEAKSSVQGGMGVYLPGKDGKMELYAGVEAEIGASVSALEIEGSAEYELIDGVEVSAEGEVNVMSAEVGASASLGIIGGEFVAHVEAGAEANLVEVNGEVGVDVGGVKGTVGGGVQVGVGATLEAGYKDGVISFNAGLSVGVGVSVNVELDVSGFVDNVSNAMDSVGEAMGSFVDGLCSVCAWWR